MYNAHQPTAFRDTAVGSTLASFTARAERNTTPCDDLDIRNILVPTDLSSAAEKALSCATSFALAFEAKITLLYVSQVQCYGTEFAFLPIEETAVIEAAKEQLDAIATRGIAPGCLKEVLVRNGSPCQEIVAAARDMHADLIVLSTHGYTGLKHLLMGSTAEVIVRHAPCSVPVVRDREPETA